MLAETRKLALVGVGAVLLAAACFITIAYAQEPVPPPVPLTFLDRLDAFFKALLAGGAVTGAGTVVGVILKILPSKAVNKFIPYLVGAVLVLGDALAVLGKFMTAAGIPAPAGPAGAGFFSSLGGFFVGIGTVGFAAFQGAVTRFIYEKYLRHIIAPASDEVQRGGF